MLTRKQGMKKNSKTPRPWCFARWDDTSQRSRLISLPYELREQIWVQCFSDNSIDFIEPNVRRASATGPGLKWLVSESSNAEERDRFQKLFKTSNALALTCRRIYTETAQMGLLFKIHQFRFFYPRIMVNFLSTIRPESRDAIQNIRLAFPWNMLHRRKGYSKVIAPKALAALSNCTSLKQLGLILATARYDHISDKWGVRCCGQHTRLWEPTYEHLIIRSLHTLIFRLRDCGLKGLRDFDLFLWEPDLESQGLLTKVLIAGENWISDKGFFGNFACPRYWWAPDTKARIERLVATIRKQVTQVRDVRSEVAALL